MDASEISDFQVRADGTALILLDPGTVRVLVDEARARKKSPAAFGVAMMREALEGAIDLRDAKRVMARIKAGKEKTTPWRKVKSDLGL